MCLITDQRKALIAKWDLEVYKLLKVDLSTYYQNFQYVRNKTYRTQIKRTKDFNCFDQIDRKYISRNYPGIFWKTDKKGLIAIGQGFHSATSRKRLRKTIVENGLYNVILVKCRIPKGSKYYLDFTGLIVSNQIIIE